VNSKFLDLMISNSFFPKITLPTRFNESHGTCTLIDNFLCKQSTMCSQTTAGICVTKLSDHNPYFICITNEVSINAAPKYVQLKPNSLDIIQFHDAITSSNIYDKLDTDISSNPNLNYEIIDHTFEEMRSKYLPIKKVKFNKHKHKKSDWITQGIVRSIKNRDKLYKDLKNTHMENPGYRPKAQIGIFQKNTK
jgi:hypothetical protein